MISKISSIAMTEAVNTVLNNHLIRKDGQEDLCFALYYPSQGKSRFTALLNRVLLPRPDDRQVHGDASFNPAYFENIISKALEQGAGIAFLHSHPEASNWQGLSQADLEAESGMAGAITAVTGLPLVGLTLSGRSGFWSGRTWFRVARNSWKPQFCETIRVVGEQLTPSFCPELRPILTISEALDRTVHAYGIEIQHKLNRLRIGVVGLGSVGSLVAEGLARMGMSDLIFIDFDQLEEVNLDRTLHAYKEHAHVKEPKALLAARSAYRSSTASSFSVEPILAGLQEEEAYRAAVDCDVLFSCVDRPWARSILNFIAYAHLIPVIDGGISCSQRKDGNLRSADVGTYVVGPDRRCLECQKQYDPGLVAVERDGLLEDPNYIEGLPDDSPLRQRENVFMFSMNLASMELQKLVQLIGKIGGVSAPCEERYIFPANMTELMNGKCKSTCHYSGIVGLGEKAGHPGTK